MSTTVSQYDALLRYLRTRLSYPVFVHGFLSSTLVHSVIEAPWRGFVTPKSTIMAAKTIVVNLVNIYCVFKLTSVCPSSFKCSLENAKRVNVPSVVFQSSLRKLVESLHIRSL